MILGIETSCDETAAALVTADGRDPRERRLLPGGAARAVRRRRPRDRIAPAPRARRAGRPGGAPRSGGEPRRRRHGRRHAGAGPDRGAPRRSLGGQGARLGTGSAARARRPSPRPRRLALPRARSGRAALPLPARERRPHAPARRPRPRRLPRARHVDRRRRRRGVRQGGAPARARLPGRRRARPACAGRRPGGVLVSRREAGRARLLVLGREDGAPLRRARSRRRSSRRARRTSRRRTSARSSGRSSSGLGRPPSRKQLDTIAVVGGVAANSELRAACREPASRRSRSAPTTPR